ATILGAFILALLPSVGGGVIRDLAFGRFPVWIIQNPRSILILLVLVFVGFIFIRLQKKICPNLSDKTFRITSHLIVFADAIGLAVFSVTGVIVSLVVKADPLWLWGPFLAFLTGAGGGMLRDLFIRSKNVSVVYGEIYGEMAIIWGAVLSIYLIITAGNTDPTHIRNAVILVVIGNVISQLCIHYFKVPNIRFGTSSDAQDPTENKESER
ncbi:MAG: TRIC cation channel family protein, partial [Alphaproteobacteria bacterium]|nr:TRIC cation channel family protein [Alphaproteobacteria bacterium]